MNNVETIALLRNIAERLGRLESLILLRHARKYKNEVGSTVKYREIVSIVCQEFNIPETVLLSATKTRWVSRARWTAWYIARQFTTLTVSQMARWTGDMDHTSVLHGINRVQETLVREKEFDLAFCRAFARSGELFAETKIMEAAE